VAVGGQDRQGQEGQRGPRQILRLVVHLRRRIRRGQRFPKARPGLPEKRLPVLGILHRRDPPGFPPDPRLGQRVGYVPGHGLPGIGPHQQEKGQRGAPLRGGLPDRPGQRPQLLRRPLLGVVHDEQGGPVGPAPEGEVGSPAHGEEGRGHEEGLPARGLQGQRHLHRRPGLPRTAGAPEDPGAVLVGGQPLQRTDHLLA
jgi:hypothetical protein